MKKNTKIGDSDELLDLTTEIVCSFVAHNSLPFSECIVLIGQVYLTLKELSRWGDRDLIKDPIAERIPAVEIKKSINEEFIVCLEEGKKFRSLKRHLWAAHGLSVDQYRTKWDLPRNYPVVAPKYSCRRSELAKNNGLGRPKKKN